MESNKHSDYITHISNDEDLIYLKSKLFPVNMRLFETSDKYKDIILQQCEYIRYLSLTKMQGYKKPHGLSSANAGLPFNIIGVVRNRNKHDEYCEIMINPVVTKQYGHDLTALSNCGSVTLDEPIVVTRSQYVRVEWYDEEGKFHDFPFTREYQGFTIQHEIQHNNGILITDL